MHSHAYMRANRQDAVVAGQKPVHMDIACAYSLPVTRQGYMHASRPTHTQDATAAGQK